MHLKWVGVVPRDYLTSSRGDSTRAMLETADVPVHPSTPKACRLSALPLHPTQCLAPRSGSSPRHRIP